MDQASFIEVMTYVLLGGSVLLVIAVPIVAAFVPVHPPVTPRVESDQARYARLTFYAVLVTAVVVVGSIVAVAGWQGMSYLAKQGIIGPVAEEWRKCEAIMIEGCQRDKYPSIPDFERDCIDRGRAWCMRRLGIEP